MAARKIVGVSYRELLESVPTMTEALERCWRMGGMAVKEAAWSVGVDYCHFQRMFRAEGGRHFPPDLIVALMERAGNQFPLDWLAHRMGQACYPLEVMDILEGIRESLRGEGRVVRFAVLPADKGLRIWEKALRL